MSIVTAVGAPEELDAVVSALEENGFSVTTLVAPAIEIGVSANVRVLRVKAGSGSGAPAAVVEPVIEGLKSTREFWMLFVSDQQPRRIEWVHDGDECEAVVGERIRWRASPTKRRPGYGPWRSGRTVWQIADGPATWRVQLSTVEPPDTWTDFLMCGNRVTVESF